MAINGIYLFKKLNLLYASKYYKILILGLDFSGKTTILNNIKNRESVRTIYNIGYYIETLFYIRLIKIVSWNLGGDSGMGKLFK